MRKSGFEAMKKASLFQKGNKTRKGLADILDTD